MQLPGGTGRRSKRSPVAAAAILAALTAAGEASLTPVVRGQTPSAPPPATATTRQADGLVRSELSLGGYTTTLSYSPALAADDPAHRAVLSVGAANARVRVAALETNGPLQIGSMALGPQGRGTARHDLWLKASSEGWTLEATESGGAPIGETAIARQAAPAMPQLSAALVPELGNTARLMVRWGAHQGTADVTVTAPPRSTRVTENRGANVTVNRSHTEDTSVLSRARLLAQRNETMMTLPSGDQLSVSFQRSFAVGERSATGAPPRTRGLASDGPDFARLATARPGDVVLLTEAAVPRLRIDRPIRFGVTEIAVGNQVPGFPGSYGLWLKRVATGWRIVFNHEPDAWGSQHDPKFDAAEVDVQHSSQHTSSRPFAVALAPTGADGGRLVVIWGAHEWSADFIVARGP